MDIFKRISEHRTEKDSLSWTGTFAEYIELLRKNPGLARTAHSRVYDMIASQGVNDQSGHKSYSFFNKSSVWIVLLRSLWKNISIPQPVDWMFASVFCC